MGVVMVWENRKLVSTGEDKGGLSEDKVHCVLRLLSNERHNYTHHRAHTKTHQHTHTGSKQQEVS